MSRSQNENGGPSTMPTAATAPGYFTRGGKTYKSTALTFYIFSLQNSYGIYDSQSITRSSSEGHVPVLSSDGDRKELGKMVLSSEYQTWMLDSTAPQFGVQMKMDILPYYEEGVFQFVHIVLSTVLQDECVRYGTVAPTLKLTLYTATDYFLWLNSLPTLRMLLNNAVKVCGDVMRERYVATQSKEKFSFRGHSLVDDEARRLAAFVQSYLGARNVLPSLSARPKRMLAAPFLFRSEFGATTAEALAACIRNLSRQPHFTSAIIVGCIACSNWVDYVGGSGARDAIGHVNYSQYYNEELPFTRVSRSAKVMEDAWADDDQYCVANGGGATQQQSTTDSYNASTSNTPRMGPSPAAGGVPPMSGGGGVPRDGSEGPAAGEYTHRPPRLHPTSQQSRKPFTHIPGGSWQSSRIVIVGPEWRALPVLMLCIFFYKRGRLLSATDPSRFVDIFGDAADGLLPSYIAGQTDTLATAYGIQWLERDELLEQEEYNALFDPTNDEGTILVIDAISERVVKYDLEKGFLEPGESTDATTGARVACFGAFSLDNVNTLELHGDETVLGWLDEAMNLAGTCAVDYFLQEQLSLTYHRALLYEQLVRSGMLDPYDFNLGFVSVRPPAFASAGSRGRSGGRGPQGAAAVGPTASMASQRHGLTVGALSAMRSRKDQLKDLARPDYDSDCDTRSEGGSSVGASSRGKGYLLARRVSGVADDDDTMSTSSSIAPAPLTAVADVGTRVWMAGVLSRATEEERFVMSNRIRVESMLGAEYTPSHGQLLHLLRFHQPT